MRRLRPARPPRPRRRAGARACARACARLAAPAVLLLAASPAVPQDAASLNFYGLPGLIDMPSAEAMPDGQFAATVSHLAGATRVSTTVQFAPWLTATFRYSRMGGWKDDGSAYFDRSVDLRFRLVEESDWMPAIAIGLQDLFGTGIYSGEYIVATRHFGPQVKATLGLGWGRLGSYDPLSSGGSRPEWDVNDTGGRPNFDAWFRGPVAAFGGVEWQATDKLAVKVEYSSDAYAQEVARGLIRHESPFNFGLEYRVNQAVTLGAAYLYGDTLGLSARLAFNPREAALPGSSAGAPLPVKPRERLAGESWGTDWAAEPANLAQIRKVSAEAMANDGMQLEAMTIEAGRASIRLRNPRYDAEPMAIGRAVRALTYILPPSVEVITVVPVVNGIAASAVSFRRSDVEALENAPDGTEAILARAAIADGAPYPARPDELAAGLFPRFTWSVQPYVSISMFGAHDKLTGSAGLRASASYEPLPGLVFSGALAQQLYQNYILRESTSTLPHVRSDGMRFFKEGSTAIERLTGAWYFRPGADLYGRVTAGYLERMFGGVSGELLWKPVDSRLAVGAELNWVKQRAFDGGFGFQDYEVATGHLSTYYALDSGYTAAVHAGRYLAGDWGATLELGREFANGWKVGAWVTRTDVSYEDFGEGSFDKGLTLTIPFSWVLGTPTRSGTSMSLGSLARDGGQRVRVEGRLYDSVRDYHAQGLGREWGMFWR